MRIIGLTGGIGSGKSTVAHYFSELGVPIIDADIIAHQLVAKGMPALEVIKHEFGDSVIDEEGNLNRAYMRGLIFTSNPSENIYKKKLESILHPLIYHQIKTEITHLKKSAPPPPYCLVVIPLLMENWDLFVDLIDEVVVVDAPEEIQFSRVQQRDLAKNRTDTQTFAIIQSQMKRSERLSKAHTVISNSDNLSTLKDQVSHLHTLWSCP